jgi:hypothetical protein
MSDRKYRQHGYQDDDRPGGGGREAPRRPRPPEPRDPRIPRDPRAPNLPGFHDVFRCARCGALGPTTIAADTRCPSCGVDLHACIHCVSPKDTRNTCDRYAPRVTVERETHSTPATQASGARKAFDDLFKF